MKETRFGFFVLSFPQYKCYQGFFIDDRFTAAAENYIRDFVAMFPDIDRDVVPNSLLETLLKLFMTSGVTGDIPTRSLVTNEMPIGVLGHVISIWAKANFFLIEGRADLAAKTVKGTIKTVSAPSLREGRAVLINLPEIVALR